MNFILEAAGPYANRRDVDNMCNELAAQPSGPWRAHAQRWTDAGTALQQASGDLDGAFKKVTIWNQSTGSNGWKAFHDEVAGGVTFLQNWNILATGVTQHLNAAADNLDSTRGSMDRLLQYWNQAKAKASSSDDAVKAAGQSEMNDAGFLAAIQMNLLSSALIRALDGVQEEFGKHDWNGPEVAKEGAGGPQAQPDASASGDGTNAAGGGPAQTKADDAKVADNGPADNKPEDKQPEAKDPVEEAGKVIDVVGKGIDLIGKVPENLDKWLTLAQHGKDLIDPGTATVDSPGPDTAHLPSDEARMVPNLAGGTGTTTPPTFHPDTAFSPSTSAGSQFPTGSIGGPGALGNSSLGQVPGTPERNTQVPKSATAAGGVGAEPGLSGRTSAAPPSGNQQSAPPMYPPQNGGMGAAGNGARDIKPGAGAGRRPGFNVPAEPSEADRLRRQGVQSDLQGRTNGEHRTPSGVPPVRKRKSARAAAHPVERDVLDEDLWRI